jgi:hypothetical protein
MSSVSGLLNVHAGIISRDIFPALFPRHAARSESLALGWAATLGVGVVITGIATVMARRGLSVFTVMVQFNTVMSLSYGPPALLGLVVRRTPHWSGMASFLASLAVGSVATFVVGAGLVATVLLMVPTGVVVFLGSALAPGEDPAHLQRRDAFFGRLDTPVDAARELAGVPDPTGAVFRFLGASTGLLGLGALALIGFAEPGERWTVIAYVALTLALAGALTLVKGARVAEPIQATEPPASASR